MDQPHPPKGERFAEFLRRLGAAPPASSFDEAYRQVCEILNGVEDDLTSIPFDPPNWMKDGRLDPPQMDNLRDDPSRPGVKQLRNRRHVTLIGDNGAIEIQDSLGRAIFAKPGADGRVI
jgi:hypothetical protein